MKLGSIGLLGLERVAGFILFYFYLFCNISLNKSLHKHDFVCVQLTSGSISLMFLIFIFSPPFDISFDQNDVISINKIVCFETQQLGDKLFWLTLSKPLNLQRLLQKAKMGFFLLTLLFNSHFRSNSQV